MNNNEVIDFIKDIKDDFKEVVRDFKEDVKVNMKDMSEKMENFNDIQIGVLSHLKQLNTYNKHCSYEREGEAKKVTDLEKAVVTVSNGFKGCKESHKKIEEVKKNVFGGVTGVLICICAIAALVISVLTFTLK